MKKVPVLRFPEFNGEWVEKRLGECIVYTQPTKYIEGEEYIKKKGKIPVLTAGKTFILGYTNNKEGVYKSVPAIIFDDFTTEMKLVKFPFKIKSSAIKILKEVNDYNLIFFYYKMLTIRYKVGGHKRHWIRVFSNFKIKIPPTLSEQEKIANFLSLIDEKIEVLEKKIEKTKEYKKGLLQKLLSIDKDKKVPVLRFPQFNGKWIEKRLGEIGEFFNGKSYEIYIVENGAYNLITLNSITLEGKLLSTHKKVNVCDDFLRKNDLVIIMSDVAKGDFLGKVAVIPTDNQYVLNQRVGGIRIIKDYNYLFVAYYINNKQKYFKKIGQGSSQKNISTNDIKNFKIHLPPTLSEQEKIANFLSLIDEKIEILEKKLEKIKEYKKGLLQKMFV